MRVRLADDPKVFLEEAAAFFRADPFTANVIAVVAARSEIGEGRDLWAAVQDEDGTPIGVAMHTPPHPLFLSRMSPEAARALAEAVADGNRNLPGVNGARESTTAFAESWHSVTGQSSTVGRSMRMYRLDTLRRPRSISGEAGIATSPHDVDLTASWLAAFHDEAMPDAPHENWGYLAERRVAAGQIHLWRDRGIPVSLAAVSGPAAGVSRIGPVFTPASLRRRGYATAVTAAATSAAKASAEHVVLYTDLANPTSNSIYQAIGYRSHHDAEERVFS